MSSARGFLVLSLLITVCLAPHGALAQMATGSYVGNGVAGRPITGIGFRPDVVLVKVDYLDVVSSANSCAVMRTSTMAGDNSKPLLNTTALTANLIQSLDSDGFTVGDEERVNWPVGNCGGAACTYYWVAFKSSPDVKVSSYVGNGAVAGAAQPVTGVGFSPEYVVALPSTGRRAVHRTNQFTVESQCFNGAAGPLVDAITSLDADGFTAVRSASPGDSQNHSGEVYHYVAWNQAPGKMRVGSYTGNGADNRSFAGIGFEPEYVLTQVFNESRDAFQRTDRMTGDASINFDDALQPNRIQALETDGFQVGNHPRVNDAPGACVGVDCQYAWVAFNAYGSCCAALSTTETSTTVTVTAPGFWEMAFDEAFGGGPTVFYDLAEDPGRTIDLAGGSSDQDGLFLDEIDSIPLAANFRSDKDPFPNIAIMRLLEATSTRTVVRAVSFFGRPTGSTVIPGIRGIGDYTVQPSGRMAVRWNREIDIPVPLNFEQLLLNAHSQAVAPLNAWAAYTQSGPLCMGCIGPDNDDWLMLQIDQPLARTDFLQILSTDWPRASRTYADSIPVQQWIENSWMNTVNVTLPVGVEEWKFLLWFKPTNFSNETDTEVVSRSADYRNPDPLSFTAGGAWTDPSELTSAGDDFNEAEAAYAVTLDPASGLSVDIDGAATPRRKPFFKIRQWRGLSPPSTITLEGSTLTRNVDFLADVMPVSRSTFARDYLWMSTLQNAAGVTSPEIGSAGSLAGAPTFEAARYGQGARVAASGDWISVPTSGNFNASRGSVFFWYRPSYNSNDGLAHDILGFVTDASNLFILEKRADDNLYFRILAGGADSEYRVNAANFSWRANEWLQMRIVWDDAAATNLQQRILIRDSEPPHVDPAVNYIGTNLAVGAELRFGNTDGDAAFSPGVFDEIEITTTVIPSTILAQGGLSGPSEFLNDPGQNFTLDFTPVDASGRGRYLVVGATAKFRGLNVGLATPGAGVPAGALEWEYWNGTGWASLESVTGFTDETDSLTRSGTVFWTDDPAGWAPSASFGGSDLYRIRVYLAPGPPYAPYPVEGLIRTDVLLLQLCSDVTLDNQTLALSPPIPTAVTLQSFEARAVAGAVSLSWTTASELDNLGFHVLRADSEDGPYSRVNPRLIPGLGSSPLGARYSYVDGGLNAGAAYFYLLEDVETSGRTKRHGPVSAVPEHEGGSTPGGTALLTFGSPSDTAMRVVQQNPQGVVLELLTPGFQVATQADGAIRIEVPGFVEEQESGAAAIPVKRVMLDAVPGRSVRILSVGELDVVRFSSLEPSRAGAAEIVAHGPGVVDARRRRLGARVESRDLEPAHAARLLSVGFQGGAKKALLELSPLRWDPRARELRLARRLMVRVAFTGRDDAEAAANPRRPRDRSGPRARLGAREKGLYAVSFEQAFGRGRPVSTATLRLGRQGESVPYHVEPRTGSFAPGSRLYFFSEGEAQNPYGREAVYELETGSAGARMAVDVASPAGPEAPVYVHRIEQEENRLYQAGLLNARDPWLWDVLFAPDRKSFPFWVRQAATGDSGSRIEIALQGASDFAASPDHHLRAYVNGTLVAEASWDGKEPFSIEAAIPPSILEQGENALAIENVGDTGAAYSMVMLDRFSVTYAREAIAERGVLSGSWSSSGAAAVRGLGSTAALVDVTEPTPRWLVGAESGADGVLRFHAEAGHSYHLASASALLRPLEIRRPSTPSLGKERSGADYLVLGPREFLRAAEPLLRLRKSQGLLVRAVAIEDVYDEFGHGEPRPEAIREFLAFAYHRWRPPALRYVLLLGDATYDFKDYLGTGVSNRVPPLLLKTSFLWTASDLAYAAVNGNDSMPDLSIGRLPAASLDEARIMVAKTIAFERGGVASRSPSILVADNADSGGNFVADAEDVAALLSGPVRKIYLTELGVDQARRSIGQAFDEGASLLSYVGHGGIHLWASENLLDVDGVRTLAPQPQEPLVLAWNCLNGYFHFPYFDSLSEALVKAEGKGAIAAFSSSGMSLDAPAHTFHRALVRELQSGVHLRLGDAVLAAQASYADSGEFPELLSLYHLLGDPGLRLRDR